MWTTFWCWTTSWSQRCSDALPALETVVATVIAQALSCLDFRDSSAFLIGGLWQQQPGAIRQLPLRRRCWSCSAATTPCKLSQRETCCKLAEAVIGDHTACRMSVLAVAEHVACTFSCFICTPSGVRIDCPCMSSGLHSIGLLTKEPCEELLIDVHYTHINALQLVQAEPRPLHGAVHSPPWACRHAPCRQALSR